jgi:hypothetical protein
VNVQPGDCAELPLTPCPPGLLQELFRVVLPPGPPALPGHVPVCAQPTIAALQDSVQVMVSLMKPKKLTFLGR